MKGLLPRTVTRRALLAFTVISLLMIIPTRGRACVVEPDQHTVRNRFTLKIYYGDKPLQGIKIEIAREMQEAPYFVLVTSTRSDEKGQSLVDGVTPGKYLLSLKHADVGGQAVWLTVISGADVGQFAEEELKLSWPHRKAFQARQVAGRIVRTPFDCSKNLPEPPLAGAKLTVMGAFYDIQPMVSEVQDDGRFSFSGLEAGVYILHIKGRPYGSDSEMEGNIFVEVAGNALDQQLPLLRRFMSECGMGIRCEGNRVDF